MTDWFVSALRFHSEPAIFMTFPVGFWISPMKLAGFNLPWHATANLLAAVVIGQFAPTAEK